MIYITDTLRISKLDGMCLQLEQYKNVVSKKTGKETMQWKGIGYYGELSHALSGAFKKQLFETAEEELTLSELIIRIKEIEDNIKKVINEMRVAPHIK